MAEDLFHRRFSCRSFRPDAIPREVLQPLLDAARWAPSAGNIQPWRFLVAAGEARRRELASAALGQTFVAAAPVVVVICALPDQSARHYGSRGQLLYALQDTAAATENLMLAATEAGLGSCWVGAFDEARVAQVLDLPFGWRPVAMVPLGWPAESPPARTRLPLDEVTIWLDG